MGFEILLSENKDNFEKVKIIIQKLPKEQKNEALLWSARNGFFDGVRLTLENKADINSQDESKRTALHLSIMNNSNKIILYLIDLNAKADILDSYKRTPLHYAVKNNNLDVVKKLITLQYQQRSVLESFNNFINIWKHFMNFKNIIRPIEAWEGFKLKYCHEYINSEDILGYTALKYALLIEDDNANEIQVYLLNREGVLVNKPNFIESSFSMGLQLILGQKLVGIAGFAAFKALEIGALLVDKHLLGQVINTSMNTTTMANFKPLSIEFGQKQLENTFRI